MRDGSLCFVENGLEAVGVFRLARKQLVLSAIPLGGGKLFDIVAVFILDELCFSPVLALAAGCPFRSRSGDMRLSEICILNGAIEIRCRHVRANTEMRCHVTAPFKALQILAGATTTTEQYH